MANKKQKKSTDQATYEKFTFESKYDKEDTATRYQRLLKEFDGKLDERLNELDTAAEEQLKTDIKNDYSNARKDYDQRRQFLNAYAGQAANLRQLVLNYDNARKMPEFLSKTFLKKYAGHEFLTEGGYPNDQFRIELLARSIKSFDEPENEDNLKQLLQLHTVLPEGTTYKLDIALIVLHCVLLGVMIAGIMLGCGPAAVIPLALGMTMMATGLFGSYLFTPMLLLGVRDNRKAYKEYTDAIPELPKRLQFFTHAEMDKNTTKKQSKDAGAKPDSGPEQRPK